MLKVSAQSSTVGFFFESCHGVYLRRRLFRILPPSVEMSDSQKRGSLRWLGIFNKLRTIELASGALATKFAKPGANEANADPPIDHAKRIRLQRPVLVLVVVGKKLGFVSGHIHIGRALRFACLAGKAEIKGSLDLLILPAAAHHLAL